MKPIFARCAGRNPHWRDRPPYIRLQMGVLGGTTLSNAVEAFFHGHARSRQLYEALVRQIASIGEATIRVRKSQIAFRRNRNFAVIWRPGQYLTGHVAPLVLTVSFPYRDSSPRWKQIAQVGPHRFTHHLELFNTSDVDAQVQRWLQEAWSAA